MIFIKKWLAILLILSLHASSVFSWGFYAHERINNWAIYRLPQPLFSFYLSHESYLREHACDPDKRRFCDTNEAVLHFIDIDRYETLLPIDSFTFIYSIDSAFWGKQFDKKNGFLPWNILKIKNALRKAFETHNVKKILKYSADLGHYIADAHVPLHTTSNYNGQLTKQNGIHAIWESVLPERFFSTISFTGPSAFFINNWQIWLIHMIESAHQELIHLFVSESNTSNKFKDSKYHLEFSHNKINRTLNQDWAMDYYAQVQKQLKQQMNASILNVASAWYSAWIESGMPDPSQFVENKQDSNDIPAFTQKIRILNDREKE